MSDIPHNDSGARMRLDLPIGGSAKDGGNTKIASSDQEQPSENQPFGPTAPVNPPFQRTLDKLLDKSRPSRISAKMQPRKEHAR